MVQERLVTVSAKEKNFQPTNSGEYIVRKGASETAGLKDLVSQDSRVPARDDHEEESDSQPIGLEADDIEPIVPDFTLDDVPEDYTESYAEEVAA